MVAVHSHAQWYTNVEKLDATGGGCMEELLWLWVYPVQAVVNVVMDASLNVQKQNVLV